MLLDEKHTGLPDLAPSVPACPGAILEGDIARQRLAVCCTVCGPSVVRPLTPGDGGNSSGDQARGDGVARSVEGRPGAGCGGRAVSRPPQYSLPRVAASHHKMLVSGENALPPIQLTLRGGGATPIFRLDLRSGARQRVFFAAGTRFARPGRPSVSLVVSVATLEPCICALREPCPRPLLTQSRPVRSSPYPPSVRRVSARSALVESARPSSPGAGRRALLGPPTNINVSDGTKRVHLVETHPTQEGL